MCVEVTILVALTVRLASTGAFTTDTFVMAYHIVSMLPMNINAVCVSFKHSIFTINTYFMSTAEWTGSTKLYFVFHVDLH